MTRTTEDIFGTAFEGGTATLLARIVSDSGSSVLAADLSAIAYSIYVLDDQDPSVRDAVPGHDQVALAPADVIFDTLQTGPPWDSSLDSLGYDFRHTPDISVHPAFPTAGRRCLVEYRLVPVSGQPILVRFRINVI